MCYVLVTLLFIYYVMAELLQPLEWRHKYEVPKYFLRSRDEIFNFIGFVIVVKKRILLNHGMLNLDEWFDW